MSKIKVLSLFSGTGGLDLGFLGMKMVNPAAAVFILIYLIFVIYTIMMEP